MTVSSGSDEDAKFTLEDARQLMRERAKEAPLASPGSSKGRLTTAIRRPGGNPVSTRTLRVGAVSVAEILGIRSPAEAVSGQPHGESPADPKYGKYYEKLLHLRDELRLRLQRRTSETLKLSKGDEIDMPHVLGQHTADGASAQVDLEMALSVFENEQELLSEIEAALERLMNGTYGICELTGQPIAEGRLEALPFTRYSLEGQRQREKERSRKVPTGRRDGPLFLYHEEETALTSNGSEDE